MMSRLPGARESLMGFEAVAKEKDQRQAEAVMGWIGQGDQHSKNAGLPRL